LYYGIVKFRFIILGVPACCAAQSACYGLRFASVLRTMRASTHALRMPNAKEVFFMGLMGLPTHPPTVKMG
jgi:hypothetical protein